MTSTEQDDLKEYQAYVQSKVTESGESDTQDFATFMYWMANTPTELNSALALRIVSNTSDGLLRTILDGYEGLPALFSYYLNELGEDDAQMPEEEFIEFKAAVRDVLDVVDRIDQVNRPGQDRTADATDENDMTAEERAELPDAFGNLQVELADVMSTNTTALNHMSIEGQPLTTWLESALLLTGCNNVFAANLHSHLDPLLVDSVPKTPAQLIKDRLAALGHPMD